MAPTRKSRSVNKQFSNYTEVSLDKDDGNLNKHRQRKRKFSDMLGSQWSEEELQRFYQAYRKHGKNWKKVAGIVHNRSVEMVEALYNMNKAYLSLPEGTASVTGLIAMMTDHYNILEGSDSDQEGNCVLSQKTQKQGRGKVQFNASKENPLPSPPVAARNDGCLSLLKRRTYNGYAVGKRTPRVPVTHSFRNDDNDNCASPNKRDQKSELGDDVENVAALTLKEASQRGGLPQVSRSPLRTDHMKSSPFQGQERMLLKFKMGQTKVCSPAIEKDCLEGSMGSRGAENEDYARDIGGLADIESVGMVEIYQKAKKFCSKKAKVEDSRTNQFPDGREARSGIKEILYLGDEKRKVDNEVTDPKIEHSSSPGRRKKNKKLFFGDESAGLDALQTLADLSLLMPTSTVESESFVRSEVEKQTVDLAQRDTAKVVGNKEKLLYGFSGLGASTSEKPKLGRDRAVRVDAITEGEQQPCSPNRTCKRKRKSSSLKDLAEEGVKFVNKSKRAAQNSSPSKQGESIRPIECCSISEEKRIVNDSTISTSEVAATSNASLPAKRRRRKMDPGRVQIQKEIKSSGNNFKDQPNKYSTFQDGTRYLKDKLACCLSSSLVRRWCTFEWFYSAIDYPWFAKREFVEYLNHVGLGHIPRLTRVEWGVIRSSLGKPRRFSKRFLLEEKEKLKQYRESVRKHYAELRAGFREGLPTDLARPLAVGQRVIALHWKSKEVHDGSVLTVDHDKCRIQFDRPELGVEFVMDIDCMPVNPLENIPEAPWRQNIGVDREPKAGKSSTGGLVVFPPNGHRENVCSPICTLVKQAKGDAVYAISQSKVAAIDTVNTPEADYYHPYMVGHSNARGEADVGALTELTSALDKKEVVMAELKHANDEVLRSECNGESLLKDSERFKKQYDMVLLQLKEASDQVSSALLNLRQRNTYPGNPLFPWPKPSATTNGFNGTPSSIDHLSTNYQESGSNVLGIVKDSRLKAHKMVDVAVQAMSSVKEGEDAFERIGEALNSSDKQKLRPHHESSTAKSLEQVNGGSLHQLGSELITSCVASLLMVQTCTEGQYPPADVAQILDSAVTSLHPHCPQNIPIYREIQKCMGRIKTQLLALVPS